MKSAAAPAKITKPSALYPQTSRLCSRASALGLVGSEGIFGRSASASGTAIALIAAHAFSMSKFPTAAAAVAANP
jgi:hypothetical protein